MTIADKTALVTGANRGIGQALVEEALRRGAVNLFGTYGVTQAFLPLLTGSRGAIVNNLSLNAFAPLPVLPAYSISKAAAFSLSQSLRALLAGRGVRVHAVLTGPVDTDMTRGLDIPKASPESVARAIFDGVENGEEDLRPAERRRAHTPDLAHELGPEPEGGHLAMKTPPIVSPQEWEAARQQLLLKEKDLTRARDALAAERRRMPWLAVEKEYEFDGPKGKASLPGLFEGRGQLIVYRAFFEPGVSGWPGHACPGCSLVADQVAHVAHLNARDTTLAFASRAPQPDIERMQARMGWKMPWYTMTDGFDTDFGVDEWHGTNAFIRDGDSVFRTYFINNRGDEAMGSTWSYLDLTALGRQEDWEDSPEGYPQTPPYAWWKWHDEYGDAKPSQWWSDPDKGDLDPADPRPRPTDPPKDGDAT